MYLYDWFSSHYCATLRRTGTAIFHGGLSAPGEIGTDTAPLPFAVSKGQLKSRATHSQAYPLDNKEAKLMGEHVRLADFSLSLLCDDTPIALFEASRFACARLGINGWHYRWCLVMVGYTLVCMTLTN